MQIVVISISDFSKNVCASFRLVEAGTTIMISRRGKIIVEIVPARDRTVTKFASFD